MKVVITQLKCSAWPEGAKLGDVVDIEGDAIPSWAAGKCEQAPADAAPVEQADKAPEAAGKAEK